MLKKATVIGRGTAGTMAYLKMLQLRFVTDGVLEINWYYDSSTKAMAVGEGTTPRFPNTLMGVQGLSMGTDMHKLDARPKIGIEYENWGKSDFVHPFNMGHHGIHFNASKFQQYVFKNCTDESDVTLIDANVSHDDIDSDVIIDCTGAPKTFEDYDIPKYIPVNAVHVTQCSWPDKPKSLYTKTIARPWGWVFVIPLLTRCSVGYLYNHEIASLDQVKADVENVFDELDVVPTDTTNSFHFNNYVRKKLIDGRVAYAGNSGFFLEPMEATTLDCVDRVLSCINDNLLQEAWNPFLQALFTEVEYFIMMHYAAGSKWRSEFWDFATERGRMAMEEAMAQPFFNDLYTKGRPSADTAYRPYFGAESYKLNLEGLGLECSVTPDWHHTQNECIMAQAAE
jgi:tryptophan halogenase